MTDKTGRRIDYMRISVTDRCNLRCVYCMPPEGVRPIGHREVLRYEEILRVAAVAARLGISKIRITGGEPLVRKGVPRLLGDLKKQDGIKTVGITTNGVLFSLYAKELKREGLDGVNFSLDCMDAETYRKMARADSFHSTAEAIRLACTMGFETKVNCVPVQGYNDHSLVRLAGLAERLPLDVRFIELMPLGLGKEFSGIPAKDVLRILVGAYGQPSVQVKSPGAGPAVYYNFSGFRGRIGFISPLTGNFCGECNRIRLTSDGFLKSCLCSGEGVALKSLLRSDAPETLLEEAICAAIKKKPARHHLEADEPYGGRMYQIGG